MKILLIRMSSAGDILLCSETVRLLKKEKKAEVHLLVKEKFKAAAKLAGADRVIASDFSGGFGALASVASGLSAEKYDMAVDLQANMRSFVILSLMKCPVKRRVKKAGLRRRLTVMFKWFLKSVKPVSETYMEAAGVKPCEPCATKRGKGNGTAVLHAGAMWRNKRWPYMAALAKGLAGIKGIKRVIITGVKDEVEKDDELLYIKSKKISVMIGKTGFEELAGIISKASFFAGNDTAAAHLAAMYNVPAMIFLGPTVESFGFITGKRFTVLQKDLGCRPCHLHGGAGCPAGHFECMRGISPEEALVTARKIISGVK